MARRKSPATARRRGETHGWTLYVVDLKKTVLKNHRFETANPGYTNRKPCVYVGVTFRTADERYQQHKAGKHAAAFVKRYGRRVRPKDCECLDPMSRKRAEKEEAALASRLRDRGWGVWSN